MNNLENMKLFFEKALNANCYWVDESKKKCLFVSMDDYRPIHLKVYLENVINEGNKEFNVKPYDKESNFQHIKIEKIIHEGKENYLIDCDEDNLIGLDVLFNYFLNPQLINSKEDVEVKKIIDKFFDKNVQK